MKRGCKTSICLGFIIALATPVRAVVNDSGESATPGDGRPYSAIWLRNVFDLKPAPTVVVAEPPKTNLPPPNVELTGITTIFQKKRALFMVQDPQLPGKPPSKPESYILSEGERQGVLEVLEINPKAGTVKIKNEEIVSTITFKTNSSAGGPGPGGGLTGAVMGGGGFSRPPGFAPPGQPPGFNPGSMPIPTRTMRPPDQSGYSPQGTGYAAPAYYGQAANNSTPGLSLPNAFTRAPSAVENAPQPEVPPEVTAAMIAIQKQIADSKGQAFPPPPPGMEIPGMDSGFAPAQATTTSSSTSTPPVQRQRPVGERFNYTPPGLPGGR